MNAFKYSAVALALAASFSASAMAPMQDADLSQVSGQEGTSIVADLNVHIGSFRYTDDGAAFAMNGIDIKGMMIATVDVLTAAVFQPAMVGAVMSHTTLSAADASAVVAAAATATGYTGQDVTQLAFPQIGAVGSTESLNARKTTPTITVADFNGFGAIQFKNLDMQGTKIWMYGH